MIKNILDSNNNVIGTLELPDATPDSIWSEKLEAYKHQQDLDSIAWEDIRSKRAKLFKDTEWIRFRHEDELKLNQNTTLTEEQYTNWLEYWKQLRNLPQTAENPSEVVFPEQPN